ncbi:MAG: hypothetical protein ACREPR_10270 [Brasilonema sp.]
MPLLAQRAVGSDSATAYLFQKPRSYTRVRVRISSSRRYELRRSQGFVRSAQEPYRR